NLCLYGHPNDSWEVNLPAEEVPPELPEPALGINFARDGMERRDWLSLIAVHSDSWLLSVAFYLGARLNRNERCEFDSLFLCFVCSYVAALSRKLVQMVWGCAGWKEAACKVRPRCLWVEGKKSQEWLGTKRSKRKEVEQPIACGEKEDGVDSWLRRGKKKRRGRRKKERRSKKREKKKENRENLDSKPFLDPDPMPPSLDDPLGMTLCIARYTRYARTIPYRAKLGKLVWYKISNPCY
ncbi:hypothetical protein BHE74_00041890, partial [Ensete ventricosum]